MKFKDTGEKSNDPFVIKSGNIKKGAIQSSYRLGWTEDSFIMNQGGGETVGRTFDFSKLKQLAYVLIIFFALIITRSAWLQIIKGDYYYKMAEGNRIRIERIEAKRGIVYDRNFKPLVRNQANFLLYFIPADLPKEANNLDIIIKRVSEILGQVKIKGDDSDKDKNEPKNKEEVEVYIRNLLAKIMPGSAKSFEPLFIEDNIDYEKAMLLHLESAGWKGVVLSSKVRREYLLSAQSLSHVIGYTGKISEKELKKVGDEYIAIDYIGKIGIENFWENELKGINGKKQIEVDAMGKEKKIISKSEPQDGNNLVLSLDVDLQNKIEEVANKTLVKHNLSKASVIAMDPSNGEILAMVNLPGYDNNSFAKGISQEEYAKLINDPNKPLFNKAVSGEFPSGSTIKPIMSAAALEEGIINESTAFLSSGGIRIGQWYFPDWKAGGHGMTNVKKAIAESVNTFFYIIGGGLDDFQGLGVDRIIKYGKMFGMGQQTGIDLPGEAKGFLPTKDWKESVKGEKWYIGDTYHLSIGQGDLITTHLQVAQFTSYFANGGKIYQPHLVKEILSGDEVEVKKIEPNLVKENIVKNSNMEIVREGMRQTVLAGSARSLQSVPVAVAGKTGTAQWSSKKDPHAWFTGFAPYDNPKIVITILIEEGKEGSSVAVPVAQEVLTWYFSER
ncbi:MAG: Peptidoglycan glycosyltransferase [Parcubacteria group bacterium GW2011_GWE2_38_18]|nr:MAG: Peptidoglycan glycosyltransferase [Parcubacteria group bacterium GW2011_GWE2_38_18]